ncbi:hypothetical protein ACI77I_20315 [Pseudomonas sp. D47]|uniref:hypothetical protein n=1 Tax=Pseudomonas sp. D47 TaxID=3159447 RepID=UPI00387ADFA5
MLAPNGRVLLIDPVWEAYVIYSHYPELTRAIVRAFADSLANSHAAISAADRLSELGFVDVQVSVVPALHTELSDVYPLLIAPLVSHAVDSKVISVEESAQWLNDLQRLAERGRFFACMSRLITTAQRPSC